MAAWVPFLPLLKRLVPLTRLVRLMSRPARPATRDPEEERRIAAIAHLLYRARAVAVDDNCLERSLLTYRFLARAGADPEIVVGVQRSAGQVAGHVWVTVDGRPVHDPPRSLERFVPLTVFGPDGSRGSAGRAADPPDGDEREAQAPR